MRIRIALAAATVAALSVVAPGPASATSHDCKILGPDYVGEVVDCVIFVYERAIG